MYTYARHNIRAFLTHLLATHLNDQALGFYQSSCVEIAAGIGEYRFIELIALASRHARRVPLSPRVIDRQQANEILPGWDPFDWNLLEALRVGLIMARDDLVGENFVKTFVLAFQYADEGELCAFYRAIPLLPEAQSFSWYMREGCRSNMRSVFCAAACDNPYPVMQFDNIAWQQLVMKALFIGVPLARVYQLKSRLSETLAVMALDFIDERNSAGRAIPSDVWILLGRYQNKFKPAVAK